jgi:hypothetical protein
MHGCFTVWVKLYAKDGKKILLEEIVMPPNVGEMEVRAMLGVIVQNSREYAQQRAQELPEATGHDG